MTDGLSAFNKMDVLLSQPPLAISIRQPWAWLILHASKDIENRRWRTQFRGRVLIHAAKGMTEAEYDDAWLFLTKIQQRIVLPHYLDFQHGGIIGSVEIVGCRTSHPSPWFCGPYGFVLANPEPLPFRPCRGSLHFFPVPVIHEH